MKTKLFALALPIPIVVGGAAIATTAVCAIAGVVGLALLFLFVLALRREIAVHVVWGKKEKKIWFERIPKVKKAKR